MYMLGLISSCKGSFLQAYPKMTLYSLPPSIGVHISLFGNILRQIEGDSPSLKMRECTLLIKKFIVKFLEQVTIEEEV